MPLTTSSADAVTRTIDVLGEPYVLSAFIGQAPMRGIYVEGNEANGNPLPQGFLVRQPAGAVTRAHFHEHNQFQVFVDGGGRFGKKPAMPLTVQYASGHTPYGPIVAGDEGVVYFTLRQRWDPGAKYMPAMREKLVRGRQRQRLVPAVALLGSEALAQLPAPVLDSLIPAEEDGLCAAMLRVPPGARAALPDAGEGGGQYHLVAGGSMVFEGEVLPRWSCQFAWPGDGSLPVTAGPRGLELLVLRFPRT